MNIIRKRDHACTPAKDSARLAARKAARNVRRTIAFEHLEQRLALATIQWDGGAGADNPYWDLAANWEGDRVPGGNDDASILAPGTNVTLRSGNVVVKSITSTAGITITSGSLNVTQGASLLSGSLTVSPGTYLNASGGSLTATGPTVANSASFYASGTGVLSLSALVSYSAAGGGSNPVIQANDAGSRINLAAVERLWGRTDSGQLAIRAYNGARVDLSGVTNYEGGAVNVLADGPNSTVDISKITRLVSTNQVTSLQARGGGAILSAAITDFDNVSLTIPGAGLPTAQIVSMTRSTISVSGSGVTPDFSRLALANQTSFYASAGAVLSLPALRAYSAAGGNFSPVIQADDAGSRINLAAVERLWGRTDSGQLAIRAYNGARVDLSGVTNYEGGAVNVLADGPNSTVDISKITRLVSTNQVTSLQASNGGLLRLSSDYVVLGSTNLTVWSGEVIGGTIDLGTGALTGDSIVRANVASSGPIRPGGSGVGRLTIQGSLTLDRSATLEIAFGGRTAGVDYDQLVVTGSTRLEGTLSLSRINSFTPLVDDVFVPLTYASYSGAFFNTTGLSLGGNLFLRPDANPTNLSLTAADSVFDVRPQLGLTTNEAGKSATFTVRLNVQPTTNVTIGLTSSRPTEGIVSPPSLVFTTSNWNLPQTVTVIGVDDNVVDGDQIYQVITAPAVASGDTNFDGKNPADVTLTNLAKDVAGITVTPTTGLTTTEAGGVASFAVVLEKRPTGNVTVALASSRPSEGTVATTSLTFTPANWMLPQSVFVTGVDDFVADSDQIFQIVTDPATSTDPLYSGLNPSDVTLTNQDNDVVGVLVTPTTPALTTSESGKSDSFVVMLRSQPTANVVIVLNSSNINEGTVSPGILTFTPSNWNLAQTVTVTGVDDSVPDGNQNYSILTSIVVSADPGYNGINPPDVPVINLDNDTPGFTVSPTTGLVVSESGSIRSFGVVLNARPSANVTTNVTSTNLKEAVVDKSSLTFTPSNWNVVQFVAITGVDDFVVDGNVTLSILLSPSVSSDTAFNGLTISSVSVTNLDNDVVGIAVSPTSGLVTTELGGTASFQVVLLTQPVADVTVGISSDKPGEGLPSVSSVVFTPATWNVPRVVTVTGQADNLADGDQAYKIITAPAVSSDPLYSGLNPSDVSLTNIDSGSNQPTFRITGYSPTVTGFVARFNRALSPGDLNLYDTQAATLGNPDVTLVGAATGAVAGSLIVSPDLLSVTFVKTGGILAVDSYVLTLRSASNGFHDAAGNLLDGNADGTAGDHFVTSLNVGPSLGWRVVSIPDFARGPGQVVNVPATGNGLPIMVSDASGVLSADLRIEYNPALLTISNAVAAPGTPADASVTINTTTPGIVFISYSSSVPMPAGSAALIVLNASVPSNAPYGSKQVIDFKSVILNENQIRSLDDDAVHVNAYFGDTTGNGGYSGLDASRTQRVVTLLDSGYDAYQLLDPVIVSDITGNGGVSSLDATRIRQFVALLSPAEIPALPAGVTPIMTGGPDPRVSLPRDLAAEPGQTIRVPLRLEHTGDVPVDLASFDFLIGFDPAKLEISGIAAGDFGTGFGLSTSIGSSSGLIVLSASTANALRLQPGQSGVLAWIDIAVKPDATPGLVALNLLGSQSTDRAGVLHSSLNEGGLTLIPAPTNAADDAIDGLISIFVKPAPVESVPTPIQPETLDPAVDLIAPRTATPQTLPAVSIPISAIPVPTKSRGKRIPLLQTAPTHTSHKPTHPGGKAIKRVVGPTPQPSHFRRRPSR